MAVYLRSKTTLVWFFLTLVTFVSSWVGTSAGAGGAGGRLDLIITTAVVAIAMMKAHLVFWHFMEVGAGPAWLRWSCEGWLAFFGVTVLALYEAVL